MSIATALWYNPGEMLLTFVKDSKVYAKRWDLKPWQINPRAIREPDFNDLCNDIKEFGQFKPVICTPEGVMLGGNRRLDAFEKLRLDDVWVNIVDLDPMSKKAFKLALADNRSYGYYLEEKVAEQTLRLKLEPMELKAISLNLARPTKLEALVNRFQPDGSTPGVHPPSNQFIVTCDDSDEAADLIDRLLGEGYDCIPIKGKGSYGV